MAGRLVAPAMMPKESYLVPGALDLTEQAIHLLRQKGRAALIDYYIGAMPFTLALLYFWSDMSRNANAGWYCSPAAAGLAMLFIWMKVWQVRYCRRLWCALNDDTPETWPTDRYWSTACRQALLHATGVLMLPISAIIMLPMAWAYAFYQNLSVLDAPDTGDLKALFRNAVQQAALWPAQNHLLLTIISIFALFVVANLAIGLMMMPYIIKWLLGIETKFTISGLHAMSNTTFLAIVCALSYLCIDPIIKSAYALRCFYGRSRHTGDDLRAALKPFLKAGALLVMVCCMASAPKAMAQHPPNPVSGVGERPPQNQEYVDQLDQTITQVLQERRFAWRLPREQLQDLGEDDPGWLARAMKWIAEKIRSLFDAFDKWLDSVSEWLRKYFGDADWQSTSGADWRWFTRVAFVTIGVGLIFLLLFSVRHWLLRRKPAKPAKERQHSGLVVDINDETISADDLPRDQWIGMAREFMERKNFRQALRALFLSVLSQLGNHERLTIARYKSNRDYQLELARRVHAEPELLETFSRCMTAYESAWYGMHPVAEPQLSKFMADQERITDLVQRAA